MDMYFISQYGPSSRDISNIFLLYKIKHKIIDDSGILRRTIQCDLVCVNVQSDYFEYHRYLRFYIDQTVYYNIFMYFSLYIRFAIKKFTFTLLHMNP